MNRLKATNSVPFANRDIAPLTGTPQYATNGNPSTPVPPTIWPAYMFNMIMDEILAVIVAGGLTPDDTNWAQLLQAIRSLNTGKNWQAFTTSGSFTPTVPIVQAIVTGGGGGGAGNGNSQSGAAGGAGGTAMGVYTVTVGTPITVTVGAAGAGAAAATGNTAGTAGLTSSFGSICSATGGLGGINNTGALVGGGAGGAGSGGIVNRAGGTGNDGYGLASTLPNGRGGGSYWGDGAPAGVTSGGQNAVNFGSGGGGGYGSSSSNGGNGAAGIVLVVW